MVDAMDRISDLPPFIIHYVMSRLSKKEVARTSVLSKRWSYLRSSFPEMDFDEHDFLEDMRSSAYSKELTPEQYGKVSTLVKNFINFVDVSLSRFCEFGLRMRRFRLCVILGDDGMHVSSSQMDKWIGLAVENGVEDLAIEVGEDDDQRYSLPPVILSSKSITTLRLVRVYINEEMFQQLISECPLLEELCMQYCVIPECVSVSDTLEKLKILEIDTAMDLEVVKIVAPNLERLVIHSDEPMSEPCVIDVALCSHLHSLRLGETIWYWRDFQVLISKFPLLEHLALTFCPFIDVDHSLKNLSLDMCPNLKSIRIDAYGMSSFFQRGSISSESYGILELHGDVDTQWFLDLSNFLGSKQIESLNIHANEVIPMKISFNLNEFTLISHPRRVGKLSLEVDEEATEPSNYAALLDGLLTVCHPKILLVEQTSQNEFIEWLQKTLMEKDFKCCDCNELKCWRHYLKDCKVTTSVVTYFESVQFSLDWHSLRC